MFAAHSPLPHKIHDFFQLSGCFAVDFNFTSMTFFYFFYIIILILRGMELPSLVMLTWPGIFSMMKS